MEYFDELPQLTLYSEQAINSVADEGSGSSSKGMPAAEVESLQAAFALLDKRGDGHIDAPELSVILGRMSLPFSGPQLDEMIVQADRDGDGRISFDDFVALVQERTGPADLVTAFKLFDLDQDGYITPEELQQVMRSFGEEMTAGEIAAMIAAADADGNGRICYGEFVNLVTTPDGGNDDEGTAFGVDPVSDGDLHDDLVTFVVPSDPENGQPAEALSPGLGAAEVVVGDMPVGEWQGRGEEAGVDAEAGSSCSSGVPGVLEGGSCDGSCIGAVRCWDPLAPPCPARARAMSSCSASTSAPSEASPDDLLPTPSTMCSHTGSAADGESSTAITSCNISCTAALSRSS